MTFFLIILADHRYEYIAIKILYFCKTFLQVKTKHLTCLTKSEDEVIQTLALKDAVESIETKSKYVR